MADHLSRSAPEKAWPDTAYVPSGGKAAIPKIAEALREIGVTVKVVVDLDILSDQFQLKRLIEALGGDWNDFDNDWRQLDVAVRDGVAALSNQEISDKIKEALDKSVDNGLPKSEIQSLLKQTSAWSMVKRYGKTYIPRGKARSYFSKLDAQLRGIGIFAVPAGEVENFCPDIGLHGPKFVSKLFASTPLDDEKLTNLRKFVSQVFGK